MFAAAPALLVTRRQARLVPRQQAQPRRQLYKSASFAVKAPTNMRCSVQCMWQVIAEHAAQVFDRGPLDIAEARRM